MTDKALSSGEIGPERDGRRLESWKEIAAYLGRDVRTVQRWERRERLPIHRLHHSKLSSVYAYTSELDEWRSGREPGTATEATDGPEVPYASRRVRVAVIALAAGLALAAGMVWFRPERSRERLASAGPRIRSLAVLPLANFSGDPEQT